MLKAETDTSTAVYYTRGFELISRREGTTASYYVYDGGLSVRALTNESGAVTDTIVFDAFGNETGRTGSSDNPYGFQGEEQDDTGLYYLRARYMDPETGTFTTMDTYGGSLTDPMSLHKYLFANSNPVMYCDPSGHSTSLGEAACVIGIIGALAGMDLYVLNIVSTGGEITPKGIALSAIIGSIVAVAIFFAIYALAYTICNAILAWGVFNSASGVLAEGVIIKMIESGLVNALEYELIWTIAGLRDIKSGTNYSDKFSGSGIIKNFVIGLILGMLGSGTDTLLTKAAGTNNVIFGLVLRVNASIVAAVCYYGGVTANNMGAPDFVVEILNYIGGYHMSIATNGLSLGEGGVINLGELISETLGVTYDIAET